MVLRGVQPDRGADQGRHHFAERAAPHPAPGPRRHHGRRDPRRRDRAVRDPGGAHRPPGLLHPPHQRRRDLDLATDRPRRRALPHQLDAGRRDGAAPGAHDLPALLDRALPVARRGARRCASRCRPARRSRSRRARAATSAAAPATSAAPASSRSCRSTTRSSTWSIEGTDAPEIKREAVKNGMRTLRQSALRAGRGRHHLRGSGPRHWVVVGMVVTIPTTTMFSAPRTARFEEACQ